MTLSRRKNNPLNVRPGSSAEVKARHDEVHSTHATGHRLTKLMRAHLAITVGGPINFMTRAEALTANEAMLRASARPWALWRKRALKEK